MPDRVAADQEVAGRLLLLSVDAEGHIDDARLAEAMMGLHRICGDVVFLGSYPRADRAEPLIREGTSNAEYAAAVAWLKRLRG